MTLVGTVWGARRAQPHRPGGPPGQRPHHRDRGELERRRRHLPGHRRRRALPAVCLRHHVDLARLSGSGRHLLPAGHLGWRRDRPAGALSATCPRPGDRDAHRLQQRRDRVGHGRRQRPGTPATAQPLDRRFGKLRRRLCRILPRRTLDCGQQRTVPAHDHRYHLVLAGLPRVRRRPPATASCTSAASTSRSWRTRSPPRCARAPVSGSSSSSFRPAMRRRAASSLSKPTIRRRRDGRSS